MTTQLQGNQDYVIQVVQYLQNTCGIIFFITPVDYHTICEWWEKRIPLHIVKDSITNVLVRWNAKNQPLKRFSSFNYEVRKNFKGFMDIKVGSDIDIDVTDTGVQSTNGNKEFAEHRETRKNWDEIDRFFSSFPTVLKPIYERFAFFCQAVKNNCCCNHDLETLHDNILELCQDDELLNMRTEIFLKNLAPELRQPGILKRYRLNYLLSKYQVPDFTSYLS